MVFTRIHWMITCFLLLSNPSSASITFSLTNITLQNQNQDIILAGNGASISDGGIQLTANMTGSALSGSAGRATYIRSLNLRELASFSTNFTFEIDSYGSNSYGYGLTFFLAENNSVISQGEAMGLPFYETPDNASSRFVAVEFDTSYEYYDPIFGRGDPVGDHVGIDVSSVSSARSLKWNSNVTGGGVCQAWIRYDSVSTNLTVSFTDFQNGTVVHRDGLFYTFDLKKELSDSVIFGFSASTGGTFQRNSVSSWSFESLDLALNPEPPPVPSPDSLNPEPPPVPSPDSMKPKVGLAVGLTAMILFLAVLAFVFWRRRKKKKSKKDVPQETGFSVEMNAEFETGIWPKQFSYSELAQSTSDFAENNKLGDGGFGRVYRGFLKDSNTYIAVKRVSKSSKQGMEEYVSEVRIISQLRHKNLVQLTGWCHEKGELLLVYDYMENGSLDLHLFNAKSLLTWSARYKIANGLASALWYLHEGWEQCVLHGDIKSSNVLLDSNFNAKLGDFGLAKLVDHEKDSETIISARKATKESDVFSFGVVALELACGRKPIERKGQEKQTRLIEWVWKLYGTDTLMEAADPHLGSDFDEEEIKRLMIVALWCVHPYLEHRPSMRQVIQVLNCQDSVPVLPKTIPVVSHLASRILSVFGVAPIIQSNSSTSVSSTS